MLTKKDLSLRSSQSRRWPAGRTFNTFTLALLLALACAEPALAAGSPGLSDWPGWPGIWEWLGLPGLLGW